MTQASFVAFYADSAGHATYRWKHEEDDQHRKQPHVAYDVTHDFP